MFRVLCQDQLSNFVRVRAWWPPAGSFPNFPALFLEAPSSAGCCSSHRGLRIPYLLCIQLKTPPAPRRFLLFPGCPLLASGFCRECSVLSQLHREGLGAWVCPAHSTVSAVQVAHSRYVIALSLDLVTLLQGLQNTRRVAVAAVSARSFPASPPLPTCKPQPGPGCCCGVTTVDKQQG